MTALSDNEIEKILRGSFLQELLYSTQGAISERFDKGEPCLPFKQ